MKCPQIEVITKRCHTNTKQHQGNTQDTKIMQQINLST